MENLCICGCGEPALFALEHCAKNVREITVLDYAVEDRGYATPCWVWLGALAAGGYGYLRKGASQQSGGDLPLGAVLHHRCEVKKCIRPEHLELLSGQREHMQGHAPKLSMPIAREIRASGESGVVLAERYGVSASSISLIRLNKQWVEGQR